MTPIPFNDPRTQLLVALSCEEALYTEEAWHAISELVVAHRPIYTVHGWETAGNVYHDIAAYHDLQLAIERAVASTPTHTSVHIMRWINGDDTDIAWDEERGLVDPTQ